MNIKRLNVSSSLVESIRLIFGAVLGAPPPNYCLAIFAQRHRRFRRVHVPENCREDTGSHCTPRLIPDLEANGPNEHLDPSGPGVNINVAFNSVL